MLSVSDKTGLIEAARALVESGVELVSTGGTRSFSPRKSSGLLIGLVEVVIWRKPFSQGRAIVIRPTFSIWPRTYLPRPPSIAFQTWSTSLKAKPVLTMPAAGTRVDSTELAWLKNSTPPLRIWDIRSVSDPSWLAGNKRISSRPLVAALMRSIASWARLFTGWVGSWPVASL